MSDVPQRPVFEGDWSKADGHQRQAHMQAVAAWKRDYAPKSTVLKGHAGSGSTEPSEAQARHAEDLQTLDGIIASSKSLASDRIRAVEAKQRILARVEAEALESEHGELVLLRHTLDTLPSDERMHALTTVLRVSEGDERMSDEQGVNAS